MGVFANGILLDPNNGNWGLLRSHLTDIQNDNTIIEALRAGLAAARRDDLFYVAVVDGELHGGCSESSAKAVGPAL